MASPQGGEPAFWHEMHSGAREQLVDELLGVICKQCDVAGSGENATISEVELQLLRGHPMQPFMLWTESRQGEGGPNPDSKRFSQYDVDGSGNVQMPELRAMVMAYLEAHSEEVPENAACPPPTLTLTPQK